MIPFAKRLLTKGAARISMKWARLLSGASLVVPYYHMVSNAHVPHVSHLYRFRSIPEFKADVEFIARHFEPLALSDIVDALNGTRQLRRPCFHLTFDDGFREMHDIVAPILEQAGVPATFFLNTAFLDGGGLAHHNILSILLDRLESREARLGAASARLESLLPPQTGDCTTVKARMLSIRYRQKSLVKSLTETLEVDVDQYVRETQPYLSTEEIAKLLDKGFTIGAHSHDHPLYADLSLDEQIAQTRTSLQWLDARFGVRPRAFAFPHNDSGVDATFFNAVFSEPPLDVSFGTGGMVGHFYPRNIERFTMEKTSAPAARILARQFLRAAYFRLRPDAVAPNGT